MKLWHCASARSLRPLWTLEEMGLPYELEVLPFPPRLFQREYLEVNSLGTVPYFVDGDTHMTESVGICQYLVDRYQRYDFGLQPDHPEYGAYLNWLHHADATLTFPQTISMRYYYLEPTPEKQAVADDYAKWYISRLRRLDEAVAPPAVDPHGTGAPEPTTARRSGYDLTDDERHQLEKMAKKRGLLKA